MKEYIDREALLQDIKETVVYTARPDRENLIGRGVRLVLDRIDAAPAADVALVVHGEWIYHDCVSTYDGTESGFSCSVCGAFITEDEFDMPGCYTDFCGSCGAKMDGKRKEGAE